MSTVAIGLWSILGLVVLVYSGLYVPVVMMLVSVIGLWIMRGNLDIAGALLAISATDSIEGYVYGVVPLFVLMGLLVMIADLGRDAFAVARQGLQRLPGSLGITTVVVIIALTAIYLQVGMVSAHFFIATGLGIAFAMLLMSALMGLVFLSSGTGHDESISDLDDEDQASGGRNL